MLSYFNASPGQTECPSLFQEGSMNDVFPDPCISENFLCFYIWEVTSLSIEFLGYKKFPLILQSYISYVFSIHSKDLKNFSSFIDI